MLKWNETERKKVVVILVTLYFILKKHVHVVMLRFFDTSKKKL